MSLLSTDKEIRYLVTMTNLFLKPSKSFITQMNKNPNFLMNIERIADAYVYKICNRNSFSKVMTPEPTTEWLI